MKITTGARLAAAAAVATLVGAAAPLAASASTPPSTPTARSALQPTSLAEVLAADGQQLDDTWYDFDIVDAAITAVLEADPQSPLAVVADGSTAATAYLPLDAAFERFAYDLSGTYPTTEDEALSTILDEVDLQTLDTVLQYHVVPRETLTYDQMVAFGGDPFGPGTPKRTLQGGELAFYGSNSGRSTSVGIQDAVLDGYGYDTLVSFDYDINVGNPQIAQPIGAVLEPFDLF